MVTHPFHPLFGRRIDVLRMRRHPSGWLYVCDGGALGPLALPEWATDRGPGRCERPLTVEVLVELVALVAALGGDAVGSVER